MENWEMINTKLHDMHTDILKNTDYQKFDGMSCISSLT